MAKNTGKSWLLYVYESGAYIKIAGVRNKDESINNTEVDVTTADSPGRFQEFLPEGSILSMTYDVTGLFENPDPGLRILKQASITGEIKTLRIVKVGEQIDGTFNVLNFNSGAPYDNAVTFTCQLKATGAPTFTYS
jgi:TP901-1 family phage major tail protein